MTEETQKDFLSFAELQDYLQCSQQHIIARDPKFPKSYNISPRKSNRQERRWLRKDIKEWILSREIKEESDS
jgi:predicted DNA-binding transcriptional regulator AlpA